MKTLLINIKKLVQVAEPAPAPRRGAQMQHLECIDDAWLLIDGEKIADYGRMSDLDPEMRRTAGKIMDISGKMVFLAGAILTPIWSMPVAVRSSSSTRSEAFLIRRLRVVGVEY
jgi:hypothetical protein